MEEKIKDMLPDIHRILTMDAPIQKVWDAVSTTEGLASWLMPNNFQLELGYEFTFQAKPMGNWDGVVRCKVMELDPPHKLGFTWHGNQMELYVSFELNKMEDEKTEFILIHSGWKAEQAMFREKMYEGWGHLTEGLQTKLGDQSDGYLS
ncbi:MAG: polyketide cyclase [Herbinix sp.]|jgi:uncharacterized protein YndB with AHSA1/START domain|nr:polyketide cyclase [Herbinix sp.]